MVIVKSVFKSIYKLGASTTFSGRLLVELVAQYVTHASQASGLGYIPTRGGKKRINFSAPQ